MDEETQMSLELKEAASSNDARPTEISAKPIGYTKDAKRRNFPGGS